MSLNSNHYDDHGGECCHNCVYSEVMEDGTMVVVSDGRRGA